mmetsp:Transcript_97211/g.251481  ORF Transcript_97211/g.251481 Transcript_97211/m.251481 type:complete len:283 (-) Transcript_97211:226-1074(-)
MRMPLQAELEVHLGHPLAAHLGLDRVLRDVPSQALRDARLDDARVMWQVLGVAREALADRVRVPERLAQNLLGLEAGVEVARDEPKGRLAVVLQADEEVAELAGVDQGLRLVGPLALGQSLRQLVGDDAVQHEVVEAVGQLLAHDGAEVGRHLRRRAARAAGAERADYVILKVQHGAVLHKDLADAVSIDVVVLHLLRGEGLHPVDQRSLLDDVDGRIEVEAAGGRWLEVPKVQVGVGEAVLRASEHAGIHELVACDLPLLQHRDKVHPVEGQLGEVDVDND